ncbi:hypothetical protein N431DRAFT_427197 [Stipitochalara longipes BDJ]|nr:hypothetical protein N431DRAFT_427197 [Stipitochalara longipes BDJ]
MSVRIRHSSLLIRKYDWIFCECISTHQPARRALHITSDARKSEVHEPSSSKPLIRRLEGVLASIQSATEELTVEDSIKPGAAEAQNKPAKKRPRGLHITKVPSDTPARNIQILRIKSRPEVKQLVRRMVAKVDTKPEAQEKRVAEDHQLPGKLLSGRRAQAQGKPSTAPSIYDSDIGTVYRISRASASGEGLVNKELPVEERLQDVSNEEVQSKTPTANPFYSGNGTQYRISRLSAQVSRLSTEIPKLGNKQPPEKSTFEPEPQRKEHSKNFLDDSIAGETYLEPSSAPRGLGFRKVVIQLPSFRKIATEEGLAFVPQRRRRTRGKVFGTVHTATRAMHKPKKRQQLLKSQGFRRVTTEKHPLFRKVSVETDPSVAYTGEHVFQKRDFLRLEDRPLVQTVEPLTIRKVKTLRSGRRRRAKPLVRMHMSMSPKDQPITATKPQELPQDPDEAIEPPIVITKPLIKVLSPLKIIKYDSLRLRTHAINFPKFAERVVIRTNRQYKEHVEVRRIKSTSDIGTEPDQALGEQVEVESAKRFAPPPEDLDQLEDIARPLSLEIPPLRKAPHKPVQIRRAVGFEDVPKGVGRPRIIKRPRNLVIQKVPVSPKAPLEPIPEGQNSSVVRGFVSSSVYQLPNGGARALSELQTERDPVEHIQPSEVNLEDWNPSDRIEHAIEAASAKRMLRDSWLTRKGDVRLAISLKFSAESLAKITRLRKKYNTNSTEFANFKVLRRLDIGAYEVCDKMLAKFVKKWEPFEMKLNEPARFMQKLRYSVGLQLDFEKLQQLEKTLLESVNDMPGTTYVNRRNTRDNSELGMMIINGKIKEAADAEHVMGLLMLEYKEGLGNIRVEGLVLHGYVQGSDTLFPPPKVFTFTGEEKQE